MSTPNDPQPTRPLPRPDATSGEGETVAAPVADRTAVHRGAGSDGGDVGSPRGPGRGRGGGDRRPLWLMAGAVLLVGFLIGGGIALMSNRTGAGTAATPRTNGPRVVASASTAATTIPTSPPVVRAVALSAVADTACTSGEHGTKPGKHGVNLDELGIKVGERRDPGGHDTFDPCSSLQVTISGFTPNRTFPVSCLPRAPGTSLASMISDGAGNGAASLSLDQCRVGPDRTVAVDVDGTTSSSVPL